MIAVQSDASFIAADESQSDARSARRLVIRIVLPTGALQAPTPAQPRLNKRALLWIAGSIAALLGWFGVSLLENEPAPASPTSAPPPAAITPSVESAPARTEAAPAVIVEPEQLDAPPRPLNEVIPDVPQNALNTIRGTIRISVRVQIDRSGAVVDAAVEEPGPSRYFRRLALEASRQWTFTPAKAEEQRTLLLRFHFRRDGVTKHTSA